MVPHTGADVADEVIFGIEGDDQWQADDGCSWSLLCHQGLGLRLPPPVVRDRVGAVLLVAWLTVSAEHRVARDVDQLRAHRTSRAGAVVRGSDHRSLVARIGRVAYERRLDPLDRGPRPEHPRVGT